MDPAMCSFCIKPELLCKECSRWHGDEASFDENQVCFECREWMGGEENREPPDSSLSPDDHSLRLFCECQRCR